MPSILERVLTYAEEEQDRDRREIQALREAVEQLMSRVNELTLLVNKKKQQ
jgi:hypothetical protein